MKLLNILFFFLFIVIITGTVNGQSKKLDQPLVHLIDSLYKADQSTALIRPSDSAAAAYQRVIRTNFPDVKNILDKYGFVGYDLAGKEGSGNYFVLVQHSDFDVAFQKRALKLMKIQVERKNASGSSYAYLVDRINLNEGREQVYGTQIQMGEGGTKLRPCADTLNLDKRRKSVGLTPIKEYLKKCDDIFNEMNKDRLKPKENKPDSAKKSGV